MRFQTTNKGNRLLVQLAGPIAEGIETKLEQLAQKIGTAAVEFDCAGVTAVNSFGARLWSAFLDDLSQRSTFEFYGCSIRYVEFASLLPTRFYARRIRSLVVPFQCLECGYSASPVHRVDDLLAASWNPKLACRDCQVELRVPPSYLEFLYAES